MPFDHYPITSIASTAFIVVGALILDRIFGEPVRWHPLMGFGRLAASLEKRLNGTFNPIITGSLDLNSVGLRASGLVAWLILLIPFVTVAYLLSHTTYGWVVDCLLLYLAIGAKSLNEHAMAIYKALSKHDLPQARHALSMIVSRDTDHLDESEIAKATVESVLENGNDAIFGAIFWFLLLGGSGAVLFRLANTLDAMWGYRTQRFVYFGWAAARIDDLLNLIPARLTALSYALSGQTTNALFCWRTQAATWYSPNAGPVMAAGAGALGVMLGGAAQYHGNTKPRPQLGIGPTPLPQDITSALMLINRSLGIWCIAIFILAITLGIYQHA